MDFTERYESLNTAQGQAVDTIEGPVMVVAGPGTGKTELLSVRAANILDKTDVLPGNILCLTFTDSAAANMRERLVGLIGPAAHKIAVHTFHSFGSEIINQKSDYFYHGAHFRPADELSTYEVLVEILEKLPHTSPIASQMNGQFTHLGDISRTISDLKKSGLTPDEVTAILDRNDAFCAWVAPHLAAAFSDRLSKKSFPLVASLLDTIADYDDEPLELIGYHPLRDTITESLQAALDAAIADNTTKPLSAWKKSYLQKDAHDQPVLRDMKISTKLRATTQVYYQYLVAMQERQLYDYDDMILRVVHGMEVFADLRYDLQETYQYIMVDEFQDTNDAQMRLIWNLTNNPASDGRPNILVVGDDDQAIYRFQGATMSNIIDFTSRYRDVKVVTLTENYRSAAPILSLARSVIVQGGERLETTLGIDKSLTAHAKPSKTALTFHQFGSESETRHSLAETILQSYRADSSQSRAVIARNHRHLMALLPHLQALDIPLRYERQDNILDSEPVQQLELVGRIVHAIALHDFAVVGELLPRLLAHPAWAVPPMDIWQLSIDAHQHKKFWLEQMLSTTGRLRDIAEWLIVASHYSLTQPLEYMCDHLYGVTDALAADTAQESDDTAVATAHEDFCSPYRAYFFPQESLDTQPGRYLSWLQSLQTLRSALREFRPNHLLQLEDLIDFLDLHRDMGLMIQSRGTVEHDESAVTLLTAHKAKGLEFDEVFVADSVETVWGRGARGRNRLIQFSSNMPLAPVGDSDDERLRLLYVALTRAKSALSLWAARTSDTGKALLPVGAITPRALTPIAHDPLPVTGIVTATTHDWQAPLLDVATATRHEVLQPLLQHYKLSATHLNNYLDIVRGGPQLFLLHNLLRFPQAMNASAAFGSAIHRTLQRAHAHLSSTSKRRPVEDVLHDFEDHLSEFQLADAEYAKQLQRGSQVLHAFLAARYDSFTPQQLVERSFATESVVVGEARITGAIDLIDIDTDEKTIFITDYKTGRPVRRWQGSTDFEHIKLHHYEQQLMMYKLLVENSRQFSGYTVTGARIEYVEPSETGDIVLLDYAYDQVKLAEFTRLVQAVWQRIQTLDFDTDHDYPLDYKGVLAFEHDLLA